jgi:hypothetical protein
MKTIRAYLENQKELAYVAFAQSMQSENINLFDAKHWLERVIHLELMIKELGNGKENKGQKA